MLAAITGVALSLLTKSATASPNARLVYGRTPDAEECPDEESFDEP
jgi:hypothetical protein